MSSAPMVTSASVQATLSERLAPTFLEVLDESAAHAGHAGANALGYGSHLRIRIASPHFQGLSRVAAHRLVYHALRPYLAAGLHALAIDIQR